MRACVAALLLCSCTGAVRVSGTSGGWRSRLRKAASTAGAAFALATAAPSTAALAAPRGASVEPLPELSLGKLLAKDVRRFSSDSFVFSDTIVSADELEEELLDVDAEKGVNPKKVAIKSAFAVGGTAAMLYYGTKVMFFVETWMLEEERRDIQDEIEKTGTFISSYAGDVETSIDARTGRNVTVVGGQLVNVTGSSRDQIPPKSSGLVVEDNDSTPLPNWLPGFVKNAIEATSKDSKQFWEEGGIQSAEQWEASSTGKIKKMKRPSKGGADEPGEGSKDDDEDDDEDDDTGGLDTLDGLIG